MSRETAMEDFLDVLLDDLEGDGKYEILEKIDHKEAVLIESATGFKFQIIVQDD